MKNELGGKIMSHFASLIPKMHDYLDDNEENLKVKGTKNCHQTKT